MNAKEMFKQLGWWFNPYDLNGLIEYRKQFEASEVTIAFVLADKEIIIDNDQFRNGVVSNLGVSEHLAIHQQMKDLGWIE